jgi:hypothetical protein
MNEKNNKQKTKENKKNKQKTGKTNGPNPIPYMFVRCFVGTNLISV